MELKNDPFDNQITPEQVQGLGKQRAVSEARTGKKDTVVVLNGRMNPPTKGHEENIKGMHKLAQEHNADHVVIASHSHDSKKNPLSPEQKEKHLKRAFPDTNIKMSTKERPTIFHHLADLHKQGYKHVVLAAGSDREEDYERIKKYNGVEGKHGLYNFKSIKVASTGERKAGISGTDLRNHVKSGNYNEFKKNLPSKIRGNEEHAKELFHDVHKGLGGVNEEYLDEEKKKKLKDDLFDISDDELEKHVDQHYDDVVNEDVEVEEDIIDEAVLTLQQRLKRARTIRRIEPKLQRMRKTKKFRMATQDVLQRRARKLAVMLVKRRVAGARGMNYSKLSASEKISIDRLAAPRMNVVGRIAQRLMPIIRRKELARLKQVRGGKGEQVKVPTNIQASYDPRVDEAFELLMQEEKQMKFSQYNKTIANRDINERFEIMMSQPTLKEEKALRQKATDANIDFNLIYGVYTDAVNEWTSDSELTAEQFAFNRVNTFIANENYFYKDVEKILSGQGSMSVVEGEDVKDTADYKIVVGKDGKKYKVRAKHLTFVKEATDIAALRNRIQKHSELALAANKAGNDEEVKKQQEHINKIRNKIAKLVRSEELDLEEGIDVASHVDKHIADFKSGKTGMDQFGSKVLAAHKSVAKAHNIDHSTAAAAVNKYVDQKLNEGLEEGKNYSVTVTHYKDGQHTKHEYNVTNAQNPRHAKHIAMQRHEKKIGGLKQGEQYSASNMSVKEIQESSDAHKVMVTVSDPQHQAVSQRKEQIMKHVIVRAGDKGEAQAKAEAFYKKKGYKVHGSEYHSKQPATSMKTEQVNERHVRFEEGEMQEKHLTPAEMKKREEIAQAIKREHPGWSVMKKMAIATAQAKKVAEEVVEEEQIDEISKETLKSYIPKAMGSKSAADFMRGVKMASGVGKSADELRKKSEKRSTGIHAAIKKLASEEIELDKLSSSQRRAIKDLRPGSKIAFDDTAGRQIHAHREGNKVHLVHHSATKSHLKTVSYNQFDEEFELAESVNLDENLAVHGKYTITTHGAIKGMSEGQPSHVTGHLNKLKKLGVPLERGEKYGKTVRVSVKNNETGDTTHHHVYQRDYQEGNKKPVVSIRDVGVPRENQREHESALKSYLTGKKPEA